MKYNDNGTIKDIVIKAGDTLPVGTVVKFDGDTIPSGWEEVEDNIITVSLNQNATVEISSAYNAKIIPLNKKECQVGNKLEFINNSIKIGPGIKHVEISANVIILNGKSSSSDRDLIIRKNTSWVASTYLINSNDSNIGYPLTITPIVTQVNEGDIISISLTSGIIENLTVRGDDTQARTYLTVKVID